MNRIAIDPNPTVNTNYGLVQGLLTVSLLGEVYQSFQGIPYAKPPLGELRFKDPQPLEPWTGVLNATKESKPAWHYNAQEKKFNRKILGTEDCLRLNIFTKDINEKVLRPVIVFIHGGVFTRGSSSPSLIGPDYLMQKDVVLVTFNFRLGVFGFMSVTNETLGIPGNAGLKDQTMALRWISENIQHFGGDPNNILLMGYSSGACSVNYHLLSEHSKNLFHKAVIMSGSAFNRRFEVPTQKIKDFYVQRLAARLGWNFEGGMTGALKVLYKARPSKIIRAQVHLLTARDRLHGFRFPYGPVVEHADNENAFISSKLLKLSRNAWSKDLPVILGSTSDEALVYWRSAKQKRSKLLKYLNFERRVPDDIGRKLTSKQKQGIGALIKKQYFRNETADQTEILHNFISMETDRLYGLGMYRLALSRLHENGTAPTYLYRFNFDSSPFKHFRLLNCKSKCHGAGHADDLSYIFRNRLVRQRSDIGDHELKVITTMVNWLYAFALKSDPNVGLETTWVPLNQQDTEHGEFKCLNIAENLSLIELPEIKRMRFWSLLYANDHLI